MTVTKTTGATLIRLSADEARARRAVLLGGVGLSEAQLRERGARYELDSCLRGVLAEIEGLDFLLG